MAPIYSLGQKEGNPDLAVDLFDRDRQSAEVAAGVSLQQPRSPIRPQASRFALNAWRGSPDPADGLTEGLPESA